ncbi:MAG: hypothetical protein PHP57_08940 [Sideroxydans sp.]|nr:hypothetical protein [Sideroxydans sp.]
MHSISLMSGLASLFLLVSCGKPSSPMIVGGPCSYTTTQGMATITALKTQADGIEVQFNFQANDSHAAAIPADMHNHLTLSTGLPTSQWVTAQKLVVGSQIPAHRQEIQTGTCTPYIYEFPTLSDAPHGA